MDGVSEPELRHRVRRSLPWSLGAGALQIALSLVSMVLLVRYLEPHEYGVWAILAALSTMVNLVISFGYGEFIVRFVPGLAPPLVRRVVWSILARRMALAALVSIALVAGFDLYADPFELTSYRLHFTIMQAALILNLGTLYLTQAMNARFMQREVLLLAFPFQTALVCLTLAGIAARQPLLYFVLATTLVAAVNFAASAWLFGRHYAPPPLGGWAAGTGETAEQKRYRRLAYVDEWGVNFLSTDIARYLISYFSSNVEVAIYTVATTIVARLQFFLPLTMLKPLADATFYTRYEETGDPAELLRMFRFLFDVNNLVALFFVAAFVPYGEELLALVFRSTYAAAYVPIVVLLVFLVLHQVPVGMLAKALKRPDILIYSKAAVVVNVALGIPLVIEYGATGMAVATAVSVAVKNVIMAVFLRRLIDLRISWRATIRGGVATVAAIAIALVLKPFHPIVTGLLVAPIAYVAAVRLLAPLEPSDRALLLDMLPGFARRWAGFALGG
jgi:O-antigen/teichoic acid export membrane protein